MEHTWGPSLGSHLAPSTGASLLTQLSGVPWSPSPPPRLGTRVGEPCHTLSRVSLPVGLVSTICTTKADGADPEPPQLQNKKHRLGPEPGSSVVVPYACSVYFVCALRALCVLRVCFCAIWGENSGHLWSWTEKHPTSPSCPPTGMSAPVNVAANPGRVHHARPRHRHKPQVLPTVLRLTLTQLQNSGVSRPDPAPGPFTRL